MYVEGLDLAEILFCLIIKQASNIQYYGVYSQGATLTEGRAIVKVYIVYM